VRCRRPERRAEREFPDPLTVHESDEETVSRVSILDPMVHNPGLFPDHSGPLRVGHELDPSIDWIGTDWIGLDMGMTVIQFLISNHSGTVDVRCFFQITMYERLTIPDVPRLRVSIRTSRGTVYEFDLIPDVYGLELVGSVKH